MGTFYKHASYYLCIGEKWHIYVTAFDIYFIINFKTQFIIETCFGPNIRNVLMEAIEDWKGFIFCTHIGIDIDTKEMTHIDIFGVYVPWSSLSGLTCLKLPSTSSESLQCLLCQCNRCSERSTGLFINIGGCVLITDLCQCSQIHVKVLDVFNI